MTSKPLAPSLMRALAALATCVFVLGLPRLLVVCTNDDAGAHLEWRHAPGDCCEHEHAGETTAPDGLHGDLPCAGSHESCEHVEFATELGPLPRAELPMVPPPAVVAMLMEQDPGTSAPRQQQFHVPATGPPRRDAPVCLHTTSLLRS